MIRAMRPLRVLVVAPSRYPLRQPHAGGLEACVWDRVRWLRARGHEVALCAAEGSDYLGDVPEFRLPVPEWMRPEESSDTEYPEGYAAAVDAAYDAALDRLIVDRHLYDVVDNHSLHPAPIRWSRAADIPVVTTLHTPPLEPMLEAAAEVRDSPHRFVAVSQATARAWSREGVDAFVFPNGIDTDQWTRGDGGASWVWSGRVVPEKAPHLAIEAARSAGAHIVLAGRIGDVDYFEQEIVPRLGVHARYVGPLRQPDLCRLVGSSAVALVTPMWEEPFGLVIAEALATGTPVAAFDIGGVSEVLAGMPGSATVMPGDVVALGKAAAELAAEGAREPLTRARTRRAAVRQHSLAQRYREVERVLAHTAQPVAARRVPAVSW
ncbi:MULTISPECIES: glycosyltransferase [Microbacterium]|uniref:glycosyltransferase n=1 Tax=Microbacterium TaxID=33882 RepID=UPI00278761D4|nr:MULTISPECIES: glycosyltransferase [Microbacterium]MDQ1085200.1 glycosyltransferase involved in cell wall biosynthesis [Microbacterium sp. SORGH_AS_0344]MDQ1169494.1 glycosyltransferase involved in cell wall biosynthesis [Microbacterium proteolyticum]